MRSDDDDLSDILGELEVGRGSPPKQYRYPKGKSGNPKGRPQQETRGLYDMLNELLERRVPTKSGKSLVGYDAYASRILDLAMQCDPRMFKHFVRLAKQTGLFEKLSLHANIQIEGDPFVAMQNEIDKVKRQLAALESGGV